MKVKEEPEHRWALVTGGASRGGAAIVRALHARGVSVVIHHTERSATQADALAIELNALRVESVRTWCCDFAGDGPAFTVPQWLVELGMSVVVCNASAYHPSSLDEQQKLNVDIAIHLTGHAAILAALGPSSPYSKLESVVGVTDIAVEQPPPGFVSYTTAKGALQSMLLALSTEWAPRVRFNVVEPGTMPFPVDWNDDARKKSILGSIPLGREGTFEELAATVVFLALDATYITGQVLAVDGGRKRFLH